jgi:hypothetical protein
MRRKLRTARCPGPVMVVRGHVSAYSKMVVRPATLEVPHADAALCLVFASSVHLRSRAMVCSLWRR